MNGRYSAEDAEQLLAKIFKVKSDFHISKVDTVTLSEEDIKHSEKRLNELEAELRRISQLLKNGNYKHVSLLAKLSLEFCPDYQTV